MRSSDEFAKHSRTEKFTAEELRECYIDKKMSVRQVAAYFHSDVRKVRKAMQREGIPVRDVYERSKLSGNGYKIHAAIQKKIDEDPDFIPHYKRPRTKRPFAINQRKYDFTYEELYDYYINQEMSVREIGDKCGVSRTVVSYTLRRLGIPTRDMRNKNPLTTYGESLASHYKQYRHNASIRNISFEIPIQRFGELVAFPCYYCGRPPYRKRGFFKFNGLDRIDSKQGYFENNVRPCCGTCNKAKGTMSDQQFIEWILRVFKHLNSDDEKEVSA